MSFSFRRLQFFVAAAEKGTISGAARAMSISQSSVTEGIQELEADLGVILFERHARGLEITQQGHQFLRHATKVLASISDAKRAFNTEGTLAEGTVNVGVSSIVAGYVVSDILARFRRANPNVKVSVIEDTGEYLEHLMIGGELDVAIMIVSNLKEKRALQTEILQVSPFRLWLPIGHHFTTAKSIKMSDLKDEEFIMLSANEITEANGQLFADAGFKPKINFKTQSVEAVRSHVATGAGLAILPDLVYRPWSLEGDRVETRDVSGELPVVKVGTVWRKGSIPKKAARDFINNSLMHKSLRKI